jgi:hypothetical protein
MGVFFDSPIGGTQAVVPVSTVHDMVHASLREAPPATADALNARTDEVVNAVAASAAPGDAVPASLQALRLLVAVGLVAGLVIGGVVTEANGWSDSSTAIWALATTAFGVIVGLLGGESKSH